MPAQTARRSFTEAKTLGAMLVERARTDTGPRVSFLGQGGRSQVALSYADIFVLARRAAALLHARGVRTGDRVLLLLQTSPAFVAGFFGCQLLGVIPVPVIPPGYPSRARADLARIAAVARIARASATLIASPDLARLAQADPATCVELGACITDDELLAATDELETLPAGEPDAAAFLQFTSGSTGSPKGVVLLQRTVLANLRAIGSALEFSTDDVGCSWLPLYHDMGLIGHLLCPMAWGVPTLLLPPDAFARRPIDWLRAIARHRATISTGSNYAYSVCARRVQPEELDGLDLSPWRLALCGGEPVELATLQAFARRFGSVGFRQEAFLPVYGMAEFTLAATFPTPGQGVRVDRIARAAFQDFARAEPARDEDAEAESPLACVSVGKPLDGHQVQIVDERGTPLPERREGEIELRGPSLMAGYHAAPEATRAALRSTWLRTGDRGYLADGELFVTGRDSERLIVRGRNLYPQDVETAAESVAGVRSGRCAAFAIRDPSQGTDLLALVCEVGKLSESQQGELRLALRRAIATRTGVSPYAILLASPGTVPRTTSGKIRRGELRRQLGSSLIDPSTRVDSDADRLPV